MSAIAADSKKILINIETASACFADCAMCPRDVIPKHGKMSMETLEKALSTAAPHFVHEISFAGRGEPALHPRIVDFLKYARGTGITTSLVTTGTTMTAEKAAPIMENVDILRLSVSSYEPQAFQRVHRGLDYKKVWSNIERLAEIAPEKVTVHLTGGPTIYETLPHTVKFLREHGINKILLFPLWNRGGDIETKQNKDGRLQLQKDLQLTPSEAEYGGGSENNAFQRDWQEGLAKNDTYCAVGDSSISINYDGKITGCFQDFGQTSVLTDVFNADLFALWQERKAILGKMPVCQRCEVNNVSVIKLHPRVS